MSKTSGPDFRRPRRGRDAHRAEPAAPGGPARRVGRSAARRGTHAVEHAARPDVHAVRREHAAGAMGSRAICPTDCFPPARSGPRCASCGATRAARPRRARCSLRSAPCTTGESRRRRARWAHRRNPSCWSKRWRALEAPGEREQDRKPLRAWLDELRAVRRNFCWRSGPANLPTAQRETLRRLGAQTFAAAPGDVASLDRHRAGRRARARADRRLVSRRSSNTILAAGCSSSTRNCASAAACTTACCRRP